MLLFQGNDSITGTHFFILYTYSAWMIDTFDILWWYLIDASQSITASCFFFSCCDHITFFKRCSKSWAGTLHKHRDVLFSLVTTKGLTSKHRRLLARLLLITRLRCPQARLLHNKILHSSRPGPASIENERQKKSGTITRFFLEPGNLGWDTPSNGTSSKHTLNEK